MKQLLFIAFIVISNAIFAQADTIPKKANTIIIEGTSTKNEYTTSITDILFQNGFGIHSSDKDQGNITTTEKSYKDGVIRLTILIKENKVLIRGQFNMNLTVNYGGVSSQFGWTEISYYGMKKSPSMLAWNEMYNIAKAITGVKTYTIN